MTQFLRHGAPITDAEMHDAVVRFAINDYDVPLRNLRRIAERWRDLAAAKAVSPGTGAMLIYLRANGYDWRAEPRETVGLSAGLAWSRRVDGGK